jgi:hypothetical protein
MDLQEDPSPLPGDPMINHHRPLAAANQVWQGPYWAVRTQNQEDPSLLPGDPRINHHRPLDTANQVWQGPYWAVRTQNRIPMMMMALAHCTV